MSSPPDGFRRRYPNIDELWDRNLTMGRNTTRVISGEAQAELEARRQRQQQAGSDQITSEREADSAPKSLPPDRLRAMFPDIDELWDPNMYMAPNIARLMSGEAQAARQAQRPGGQRQHSMSFGQGSYGVSAPDFAGLYRSFLATQASQRQNQQQAGDGPNNPQTKGTHAQDLGHESRIDLTGIHLGPRPHSSQHSALATRQKATASVASNQQVSYKEQCEDIIHALRRPDPQDLQSPLLALQQQVLNIFKYGPQRATGVYGSLSEAAQSGLTKAEFPDYDLPLSWKSCKAAATLVGILACPADRVYEVVKFLSHMLGGLPTLKEIRSTPSASLQTAFRNAKALALGEKSISTVITVSLTDVYVFELADQGKSENYTSFAHNFVLGIGPEGVIIWQGWGEHGYGLDQWINDGDARVRTWQEANDLVNVFETFATYKGRWDAKRNKLYKKLFNVDIFQICGGKGPSKPIIPKAESWVRLLVMGNVKLDDIYKFTFE